MDRRGPGQRYASFDYCFNYFQAFREQDQIGGIAERDNVQLSCLQLGFYLASWGMFRSSVLRTRSLKQFEPVIEVIAHTPRRIWDIDAHGYSTETCGLLTSTAAEIRSALQYPDGERPTNTLVTKIMLGVFGNVPAFDNYVVGDEERPGSSAGSAPTRSPRSASFTETTPNRSSSIAATPWTSPPGRSLNGAIPAPRLSMRSSTSKAALAALGRDENPAETPSAHGRPRLAESWQAQNHHPRACRPVPFRRLNRWAT